MAESQRAQSCVVDQNPVPRPYPSRTEQIPMERFRPDADWIGRIMANKYPGIVAETMEVVQIFDSHTTKIRVAVDWNDAGKAAGLPRNLCIKSNWGGQFDNVDIHALEARFYHFLTDKLTAQRSEEHTSELQSLMRISYAVFCLKKKTKIPRKHT